MMIIKGTGYSCVRRAKCVGKCILKLANQKNLWYEQREQLDPRGGGALSQGAAHRPWRILLELSPIFLFFFSPVINLFFFLIPWQYL